MSLKEVEIEREIKEKQLDAPRLSPEKIDAVIVGEDFYVFPNTALTICCLKLRNGFVVTGKSSPVSIENFDQEIGRKIAKENARGKVWMLEGYLLKERLTYSGKEV